MDQLFDPHDDHANRPPAFNTPLLAYTSASKATEYAPIAAAENLGAVLTAPDSPGTLRRAVKKMRMANPSATILLDKQRYAGPGRSFGGNSLDPEWFRYQRDTLGLPWRLTDSWFVRSADTSSLQRLLDQAGALGRGVLVALPLARTWLTHDSDQLTSLIEAADLPVALMIEDDADPLGAPDAVRGLVRVISSDVPVLLLRSDVAAIGALAFGAVAAAVGTIAKFRHIAPIRDEDSFAPSGRSTVVPGLLSYRWLDTIERAIQRKPHLATWKCGCAICGRRRLDWIRSSPDEAVSSFQHSIAALAGMVRSLMTSPEGAERQRAWRDMCSQAITRHGTVIGRGSRTWQPQPALRRWIEETRPVGVPD